MSARRYFDVSGINLRVHTKHASEEYAALWRDLFSKKKNVMHANNALMIGGYTSAGRDFITGNFYRFLQVDIDAPWFDIEKHKKAADEDVGQVKIPPALKPNLVEIPYVFDLRRHRLYFVSHEHDFNLSPIMVEKLLQRLTSLPSIVARYGDIDLSVLTDRGKVHEMLKWPVIRNLTIVLERPNPVEPEDDETVYERLERRRLKSETHSYQKARGEESIILDDEMRAQAENAINNGLVKVSGRNLAGEPGTVISSSFPLKLKGTYTPSGLTAQTLKDALLSLVKDLGAHR
jgi:hypothetical protein